MPRLHKRPQLCKHCAALIRQKSCRSSFRRPAELARRHNLFSERFKTRITPQRIEERINSNPAYVIPSSILIGFFEPTERLFFVAKSEIGKSKGIRCDVPLFGYFL